MLKQTAKQELMWRYAQTDEDIGDLAERFGLPFDETLKILRPHIEEEALTRRGLLRG